MKRPDTPLYRHLELDRAAPRDEERRSVPAALSSEIEVPRWFGREVLSHDPEAVDLSRAADGLPLLWNHHSDIPVGIVEDVRLDGDKLRGILRFSRNAKAEEVWRDVKDGMLRNLSVGYRIDDWKELPDSDLVRVTRWTLLEASIAPVPADPTIGIGRSADVAPISPSSIEVSPMTVETPAAPVAVPATSEPAVAPVINLAAIRRDLDIARNDARQDAIRAERQRTADVSSVFDLSIVPHTPEMAALRAKALDEGWSVDQTRQIVLQALCQQTAPVVDHRSISDDSLGLRQDRALSASPVAPASRGATVTEDALDKFKAGAAESLIVRAGLDSSRDAIRKAREGGYVGVRLSRMAEMYLNLIGVDTRGLNDDQLAQRALATRAHGMTTSDFANLLANTANKALLLGWEQAPETWQQWVRIGQVPDFKLASRVGLSGFSSLAVVPEDGEITYGKFTDRKETIQAVSYAKKFRLTYQAIKNDDLGAFTAIPRGMGRAAQAVIGDIVYGLLNGVGPTLNQDSTALFDASAHKNYVASADAPTTTTLDTAFTAMAKQTDPNNGHVLNIIPRYLLVPKALETSARVLVSSMYDPGATGSSKNQFTPNPFMGRVEVISDARLDAHGTHGTAGTVGTKAWYLAADPNRFDTVEVAFVDGIAEPYLREEEEWDTRGVEWVVGVDFGVAALDYRGLHKYKGA